MRLTKTVKKALAVNIYRSVLRYMSSSVIPQQVSVSFHTGLSVLRTVLVFSLLACKSQQRGRGNKNVTQRKNKCFTPANLKLHLSVICFFFPFSFFTQNVLIIKADLASSWKKMQLDIRISQTVEIHRFQTLMDTNGGNMRCVQHRDREEGVGEQGPNSLFKNNVEN